jgi:transposase-like protein
MSKRGRPAFKPTATQRRIVREMKSVGESDERVAQALGIDSNTLRKHFRTQLDHGLAIQRREIVAMLYTSARSGNVSAMKRLEELSRVAGAAAHFVDEVAPKPPELGKKEAAAQAALTAGDNSDWGDDLRTPPTRPN